jgi:hypothetical protein
MARRNHEAPHLARRRDASDPNALPQQITMAELPSLSKT